MVRRRVWTFVALAGLASAACLGTEVGSNEVVYGVVTGRITRTDGTGVANALLNVQLESVPVNGTAQVLSAGQLSSADDGNYLVTWIVQDKVDMPARVRLSVTPPIGSQLVSKDTADVPINLHKIQPPVDTAYLFITLQPRS